jgi:hypothetical protein
MDYSTSTTGQSPPNYGGISYVYLFLPWNYKGGQSKVWLSCLIGSVADCLPLLHRIQHLVKVFLRN